MMGLLLALIAAADADAADGLTLTVQADDIPSTDGQVLFALYDREDAWLDPAAAVQSRAAVPSGPSATVTFTGLAPGTYAVSIIHDENRSGGLDMQWLPYPRPAEAAGASNNAPASFGPPRYPDAALSLSEDLRIVVKLRK